MYIEMHPSIKVLLLPWEMKDYKKLQLFIYPNNHNTPNAKKFCEIVNNMAGNPLDVENKHIKEWVTGEWLGVFWKYKVSLFWKNHIL